MARQPVSVTLDSDNLLWLRGQAGPSRSVSRIVDELVGEARASRRNRGETARSVVGTVNLHDFDPVSADHEIRALFDGTRGSTGAVHETHARYVRQRRKAKR